MKKQKENASQEYVETKSFLLNLSENSLTLIHADEDFDMQHIRSRSTIYNNYLTNYVKFYKAKSWMQLIMRGLFFVVIVSASILIVWSCFSCISVTLQSNRFELADAIAIVSALAGMLTAFIALPEIVAKNLFPQKEDDVSAELFNLMFKHDVELRKLYNNQQIQKNDNTSEISEIEKSSIKDDAK